MVSAVEAGAPIRVNAVTVAPSSHTPAAKRDRHRSEQHDYGNEHQELNQGCTESKGECQDPERGPDARMNDKRQQERPADASPRKENPTRRSRKRTAKLSRG